MTLAMAWRDARGIKMAADSRLNFNHVYVDQGIKVVATPYRIYGPGEREPGNIVTAGALGMCFAGSAVAALTLSEALRDVLTQMQAVPGYSDTGMDGIVDLLWRTYEILQTDLCEALFENGLAKVIVAGHCAVEQRERAFLFDVNKQTYARSLREILHNVGDVEMIGLGEANARRILPPQPSQGDYIDTLQKVIDDPAEPTVGGQVQYGEFSGPTFGVMGVACLGEHAVHYWRSGLDLNDDALTSGNGLVLGYPLLNRI
jgi:hypothetical protein